MAVFIFYLNVSGIGTNTEADLLKVTNGTAYKPFQYRILVPWTIKLFLSIIPEGMISNWHIPTFEKAVNQLARGTVTGQPAAQLAVIIMFLSLIGSAFALKTLMRHLGYSTMAADVISLVYPVTLTVFFDFAYI